MYNNTPYDKINKALRDSLYSQKSEDGSFSPDSAYTDAVDVPYTDILGNNYTN